MKKALSIVLSLMLLLAVVPVGTISTGALEDEVIEIRTIAELYNINNNMSGNYKLMNDIDMTEDTAVGGDWDFMGNGWEPIGSEGIYSNTPFTGTFDGDGHKIIGMRINLNTFPSGTSTFYLGLFANNAGTIKNLGIDSTCKVNNGRTYAGGICAYNSGNISNCYNEAGITSSVSYSSYSGGICAYNNGSMSDCYNTADVSSGAYSGGICAHNGGTISNCYNKAAIASSVNNSYSGGICAYNSGDISNCYNNAAISSGKYSGGICGYSNSGYFINCYNTGNISSSGNNATCSGGICGNNGSVVSNCFNTGDVTSSTNYQTSKRSSGTVSARVDVFCGGICGVSSMDISTSYNTGKVSSSVSSKVVNTYRTDLDYYSSQYTDAYSSSYAYTGGICGQQNSGAISRCYNTANTLTTVQATAQYYACVRVYDYIHQEYDYRFNSSYSNGSTYKYDYCGGIAGEANGRIDGCYNIGKATYGIKYTGKGTVANCYYLSTAGSSNTGANALTNAQLKLEMCMPKFDFENTWVIYHTTEYNYPQLRCNLQDEPLMIGDANGDGIIDITDATCIQKHLAEYENDDYIEEASDTNKDGKISIRDVTAIQRYLAEMPSNYVGKPIG